LYRENNLSDEASGLEELLDRQRISECMLRYARGMEQ